jgi:urea transport system ATP-binding protein
MPAMLSVQDLRAVYGQSEMLHGIDLDMARGEIVAIMGRTGMGKTALMKALMGGVPEKGGSATVDGTPVTGLKPHARVRHGLGYVPRGRMVSGAMTVRENIETGLTSTDAKTLPENIYALFPVLQEMKSRLGGNLSGGQQQHLVIARALASNPKVLLLDGPTEGIPPSIIREMARALRHIRDEKGLSVVVSNQVLSFALDVAERVIVIVIHNGTFVHDSPRAGIDEARVSKFPSV